MSNPLSPEVRVNKNGVAVTKHVRTDIKRVSGKTGIPAPKVQSAEQNAKRLPAARLVPKKWESMSSAGADPALITAAAKLAPAFRHDGFHASDVEAYSVMAVVHPRNVSPLLSCGVRTGDDALQFLRSNGLEHLIMDNSGLAEGALMQGAKPQSVIQLAKDMPEITLDHPLYFDAVYVHGGKALRWTEQSYGVTRRVLDGKISAKDVKVIGGTRIASAGGKSAVLEEMERINAGQSEMDIETLAKVVAKSDRRNGGKADSYTVNETVHLARRYGADTVIQMERTNGMSNAARQFSKLGADDAEIGRMIFWQEQVRKINRKFIDAKGVASLYRAGISPEVASEYYQDDMTPQQVIAISEEGVMPSVSSGWL